MVDAANPRKFTGGKLQLSIRLRNPIASRDIISRHEVWSELTVSGDNLAPEKIELNKSQIVTATDNVSSKDCGVRETVSKYVNNPVFHLESAVLLFFRLT